jgi:hypothetical protein
LAAGVLMAAVGAVAAGVVVGAVVEGAAVAAGCEGCWLQAAASPDSSNKERRFMGIKGVGCAY